MEQQTINAGKQQKTIQPIWSSKSLAENRVTFKSFFFSCHSKGRKVIYYLSPSNTAELLQFKHAFCFTCGSIRFIQCSSSYFWCISKCGSIHWCHLSNDTTQFMMLSLGTNSNGVSCTVCVRNNLVCYLILKKREIIRLYSVK